MPTTDKRVDAYIAKSADFAKPILNHLRELVHSACPDVEEKMKWSFPHFDYKGLMMCSMAAFKLHATFGLWKAKLMKDPHGILGETEQAMGHFGRLAKLSDLPSDKILTGFIKQAMKLNEEGIALDFSKRKPKPELKAPAYFAKALVANRKARAAFATFSPSAKRDYIEWFVEAKTEETRKRRLETAIEWISEGKIRNWKYVKK
jgi:uncharacterized protein YdeI (YjbR/CyaY-like superfamily)